MGSPVLAVIRRVALLRVFMGYARDENSLSSATPEACMRAGVDEKSLALCSIPITEDSLTASDVHDVWWGSLKNLCIVVSSL